jgi:hypothetical protein
VNTITGCGAGGGAGACAAVAVLEATEGGRLSGPAIIGAGGATGAGVAEAGGRGVEPAVRGVCCGAGAFGSFFGGALAGLPAMAPACAAVGFGDDLACLALACDSLGDGAGRTSGDTVRSKPMSGNGATGLLSFLVGRPSPGKDGGGGAAGPEEEVVSRTGGSMSMVMGAGGATGFGAGAAVGGGILLARKSLRSRSKTDFARTYGVLVLVARYRRRGYLLSPSPDHRVRS